jgi:hypothetical protein
LNLSYSSGGPYVNLYISKTGTYAFSYSSSFSTDNYISGTDTFLLTSNIDTGTSVSETAVGGIMTDDDTLVIDFDTKDITVVNTNGSGLFTAGFGYVSDTAFGGTLNATNASNSTYSVTASAGSALGFIFVETDQTTFVDLDSATIDLSGTTIEVTNSSTGVGQAVGFAAGDLTNSSSIKLGNIVVSSSNSPVDPDTDTIVTNTYGFLAGDVTDSSVLIGDVKIDAKYHSYGVALDEITGSGSSVKVGDINITTTDDGHAYGFHVKSIDTATLEITGITINAATNGTGFYIPSPPDSNSEPINLSSTVTIGDIDVTSKERAIGFFIESANATLSLSNYAPKITGTVTLNDISVKSTNASANGTAIGVALGTWTGPTVDLGSADADSLILKGDITAESTTDYAFGIHAGQLKGLDVNTTISAKTDSTSSSYYAYGIFTRGHTESTDRGNPTENSVINIQNGASIFATPGAIGSTAASIAMSSVDKDVVNIDAGTTGSEWTNDGIAFTWLGVEVVNVTEDSVVDLSGTDSLRGRATAASGVAVTNVEGELKVKDTFFNDGTGSRKSNIYVTESGKLELTDGSTTQLTGGSVDQLTIDGENAEFTLGVGAELKFGNSSAADQISITNGGTFNIETDGNSSAPQGGVYNAAQAMEFAKPENERNFLSKEIGVTVNNGTIKVTNEETSNTDKKQDVFAGGLKRRLLIRQRLMLVLMLYLVSAMWKPMALLLLISLKQVTAF